MSVSAYQRRTAYDSVEHRADFALKPLDEHEPKPKTKQSLEQYDISRGTVYPKPFEVPGDNLLQLA